MNKRRRAAAKHRRAHGIVRGLSAHRYGSARRDGWPRDAALFWALLRFDYRVYSGPVLALESATSVDAVDPVAANQHEPTTRD